METYEAMYIFPDRLKDDEVDGVLKNARGEIERLEGRVVSATRLGRRPFARPIKKTHYGHYAVVIFSINKEHIPTLQARARLNDDIVRVQIVRTQSHPIAAAATGA